MKRILFILFILPFIASAQKKGIQWTEGLSWEQVKQKAEKENKFIFLDVFATWCGPCKLMDKEVYPNDTLGNFFNERFISVRMQTDRTPNDNEQVKSWYSDAEAIARQFRVEGYPSFVFLNPQGIRVEMQSGYKSAAELIALGKTALTPGKKYDDPYAEYKILLTEYKEGKRNMERMPYFLGIAISSDTAVFRQAIKEYTNYCMTLKPEERYTKDNVQMWSNWALKSTTRAFQFFYKDGELIDRVMNQKGFAREVVARTIEQEIVWPFLREQSNGRVEPGGAILSGPDLTSDYSEADWKKLAKMIKKQYGASYVDKSVLNARIQWYMHNQNLNALSKWQLIQLKKYPPPDIKRAAGMINSTAWGIFLNATDKRLLSEALGWTTKLANKDLAGSNLMDTHANLLYKLGRKQEAVEWELNAIAAAKSQSKKESMTQALEQMKRNEPTYLSHGVKWEGINTINWKGFKYSIRVVVRNEKQEPIVGVSIFNKNLNSLKLSDKKGTVVMEVELGDRIGISMPGYNSEEVSTTKDSSPLQVTLKQKP